jgi:dolichol-phosphate mannosyltransferase
MRLSSSKHTSKWELPEFEIHNFLPKKNKYCICIPVINEGEKFKKQIVKLKKFSDIVDILIADGGSTDNSTNHQFLKKNKVRTLLVKKSAGRLGTQLRMGFAYALKQGYDGIITVDGNGKDGIEAIPVFLKKFREGYDFIQGSRFIKGGKAINTPLMRYLAIRLIHAPLISIGAHHWYTDTTNGFRGYSKKFLLDPRVKPFRNIFVKYEFLFYHSVAAPRLNFAVAEIPVTRAYPKGLTPTKIKGIRGNIDLLATTFKVLRGHYKP